MNTIIELHDSKIAEITRKDDCVVLSFLPAYLHKSEGRPGFDSGTGWTQAAKLIFANASVSGNFPELPCTTMGGNLVIGGQLYDNEVPVPLDVAAAIELRLICDAVHEILVTGHGVRLELLGEARYIEEFKAR